MIWCTRISHSVRCSENLIQSGTGYTFPRYNYLTSENNKRVYKKKHPKTVPLWLAVTACKYFVDEKSMKKYWTIDHWVESCVEKWAKWRLWTIRSTSYIEYSVCFVYKLLSPKYHMRLILINGFWFDCTLLLNLFKTCHPLIHLCVASSIPYNQAMVRPHP